MCRLVAAMLGLAVALAPLSSPVHAQTTDSTYTVKEGDTLYSIAQEVGVSVRTLMQWNGLDDTDLQVGETLRVRPPSTSSTEAPPSQPSQQNSDQQEPPPSETDPAASEETTTPDAPSPSVDTTRPPRPYGRYTAKEGDTFVNLALRLGTTTDSLYALNDSTTAPLSSGRSLRLPRRFAPPTHVVDEGQTLYSIAGEYGVSVRALKAENDLESNTLKPGQRLTIPGRGGTDLPPPGEWAAPDSTGRVAIYPAAYAGRLTASGTTYAPNDFVVSHPSLPFNSVVLLSSQDPENHTFARVIDRGPIEEGVLLDVSDAVATELGLDTEKKPPVALRVVWVANDSD
ncbi:LysM peptidoglycan-binding domain-containing protein [Salinibacter sp. 10B]|uniref:LysM peptidoglycan-binding domain-containing protein n=1 Tax=Salinibacter sp. 10B TaxID=1923971 RepID=UPI0021589344|nr:LysM peptidoglycan-binding domain-containing protein [Salinibacter sp. 10B]